MSDFIAKFLPNTVRNEIDYLQKGKLALNAETPKPLANNKEFVTYLIASNLPCDLKYAGPDIRKEINKALNNVENCSNTTAPGIDKKEDGRSRRIIDAEKVIASRDDTKAISLEFADEDVCDNFDIVLASVCKDVCNFQHASRRLRNDFTIAFAAIKYSKEIDGYYPITLAYVGEELRDDYDFALEIIRFSPDCISAISHRLQNNRKIILEVADRLDAPRCKLILHGIITSYLAQSGRFNANNFEFICMILDIIKLKLGKDDFVTFALNSVVPCMNIYLSYGDVSINIIKKYNIKIPATHRSSFSKEFMEKYDALGIN